MHDVENINTCQCNWCQITSPMLEQVQFKLSGQLKTDFRTFVNNYISILEDLSFTEMKLSELIKNSIGNQI
jgi:hypothetical protein